MNLFKPRGKHAQKKTKKATSEGVIAPEETIAEKLAAEEAIELEDSVLEEAATLESTENAEAPESENAGDEETKPVPAPVVEPIEPTESAEQAAGFNAGEFGEIPKKKSRRALKAFGITVGVIVLIAAITYFTGVVVFMSRFLPNTTIGGNNVSLKTDEEVMELLDSAAADYQLNVIGGGFSYHTTGKKIGLSVDAQQIVNDMHSDMNAWEWPLLIVQQNHDETNRLIVSVKESAYRTDLLDALDKFNESAKDPVDAEIVYDAKTEKFVVKPEEAGTKFDKTVVLSDVNQAIAALEPKVSLGDEQLIQPTVFSTDEKLIEAAELATGMVSADLTLIMGGQSVGEVNGETLSNFIAVDDKFGVTFKDDEMTAWVDSLAEGFNTLGAERTYTRADSKEITVSGGVYGWEIDTDALKEAVLEGIKAGTAAKIEVPCYETAAVFNGAHQRDWGNRYIDVDISEQYVRFYGDDGSIIWEADCITGKPDGKHDTVKGVWTVNAKESPSKLIGYENGKKIYESSVTYWMPFEGNGIGFHDATWQPSFGGYMYANGYGSHGCVNLSYSDAQSLYSIIQVDDVVVVHG